MNPSSAGTKYDTLSETHYSLSHSGILAATSSSRRGDLQLAHSRKPSVLVGIAILSCNPPGWLLVARPCGNSVVIIASSPSSIFVVIVVVVAAGDDDASLLITYSPRLNKLVLR